MQKSLTQTLSFNIYIYFTILKKHRASKAKDLFLLPFADGNNQLMLAY